YHEFLPQSQAELAIPLQIGNELIGILDVHSAKSKAFTTDEISALVTLAAQISIATKNARAFREQQETAERLQEINKLKNQFLANMSHELRTPLNSIIGFSRVILKGIDGPLTELQKTDLTSIHNSGQHLLSLINNILDLSKIEAGKMDLNFEKVELEPIIKGVMSTAVALVKDKPVTLHQDLADDLPIIWADPTRIRQVILNLISNACKFTDEGSVTLEARRQENDILIRVTDTGVGIPEDQLQSIFEEFTQVDASTTRKVGGTGLGLSISRHFIEMHHGQIWVESVENKGSTFSFTIPITKTETVTDDTEDIASEEIDEKVIVAIDDDLTVIQLYERFLEPQGYKVVGITDGENVVERVKAHAPSGILLDVLMPKKDGWSLIRELKDDPETENIPVIICSIVSDKKKGFSLGAADYMTKPINENDLRKALSHLENQQKSQIKVLVIDDQADDVLLIRRILEAQPNYSIIEANSGQQGLEMVPTENPDLIILDLSMPEIDGFSVVEALKNNDATRSIPIIIVSGKDLTLQEDEFLTGQVEALLQKGLFNERELLEDVREALSTLQQNDVIKI
ncbi:MAG: response regulator, partial [Anaerolineae bacterium]|nr:response regulator [Anaerolineae bacterium]